MANDGTNQLILFGGLAAAAYFLIRKATDNVDAGNIGGYAGNDFTSTGSSTVDKTIIRNETIRDIFDSGLFGGSSNGDNNNSIFSGLTKKWTNPAPKLLSDEVKKKILATPRVSDGKLYLTSADADKVLLPTAVDARKQLSSKEHKAKAATYSALPLSVRFASFSKDKNIVNKV